MQILIACAKIMTDRQSSNVPMLTSPAFQNIATAIALELSKYSPNELQELLHVNKKIASENWRRYQDFPNPDSLMPAVFSYDGMVFQKLAPESMSEGDLAYANNHLFVGSFLYGLLRPLDRIHCYRLEGNVELSYTDDKTLFDFWKPVLTDWFIKKVKEDDGILVNLASNEFKDLFDWTRVQKELTVITPEFKVEKDGKLKTIVIYTKMCRGAMTRWIIQNRITEIEKLRDFQYEGFGYESDWQYNLR